MDEIWVLHYRYSDGSSAGVVRAYTDEQRANEDLDLLSDYCSGKTYELTSTTVYGPDD